MKWRNYPGEYQIVEIPCLDKEQDQLHGTLTCRICSKVFEQLFRNMKISTSYAGWLKNWFMVFVVVRVTD